MTPIERIRAELPLTRAWRILDLPGTPAANRDLHSPLRQDKKPSFRLYQARDHLRWIDHATGEGGDVVDLWAKIKGIPIPEATRDILAYLDGNRPNTPYRYKGPKENAPECPRIAFDEQSAILWPENLSEPSETECRALGELRGLSPEAFFLAGKLGTLLMGDKRGQRIWMTCDRKMRSAAMRRLDGENLELINKKSAAPRNSFRDWPVGLMTRNSAYDALNNILLVEGEGDYYAGLQLAITSEIDFRVVCVMGANTTRFGDEARPLLRGKKILLIGHNDPAGQAALPKWVKELYRLGVKDVVTQALPFEHDDLNDFVKDGCSLELLNLPKGFDA
jgi:hypothetical protein